ncbi:MAG: SPOR domain-containing protein, partial [Bradyrhizobium sp.]|nr:SPOR domain-containing protein [Bradyrhizobium sp.]
MRNRTTWTPPARGALRKAPKQIPAPATAPADPAPAARATAAVAATGLAEAKQAICPAGI